MAGRGVGGVQQLRLSRGQARAHVTGACSGGVVAQAGAVFCTGLGRQGKVKECLAQRSGAEDEEEEVQLGAAKTPDALRSLAVDSSVSAAMRSRAATPAFPTSLTPGQSVIVQASHTQAPSRSRVPS